MHACWYHHASLLFSSPTFPFRPVKKKRLLLLLLLITNIEHSWSFFKLIHCKISYKALLAFFICQGEEGLVHFQWLDRTLNSVEHVSLSISIPMQDLMDILPLFSSRWIYFSHRCFFMVLDDALFGFFYFPRFQFPWQVVSQDQIIFPDEAVFEKVSICIIL